MQAFLNLYLLLTIFGHIYGSFFPQGVPPPPQKKGKEPLVAV